MIYNGFNLLYLFQNLDYPLSDSFSSVAWVGLKQVPNFAGYVIVSTEHFFFSFHHHRGEMGEGGAEMMGVGKGEERESLLITFPLIVLISRVFFFPHDKGGG